MKPSEQTPRHFFDWTRTCPNCSVLLIPNDWVGIDCFTFRMGCRHCLQRRHRSCNLMFKALYTNMHHHDLLDATARFVPLYETRR